MIESKEIISAEEFERVVPHDERVRVAAVYDEVLRENREQLNYNYFKAPQLYDPYTDHVGPINGNLTLLPDLSRCNMSSLYFLSQLGGDQTVLDYACGMSGYIKYAREYFPKAFGFDRWVQIPRTAAEDFNVRLGVPKSALIEFDEIEPLKPTVVNVAGYWIEDTELYSLPSLRYIISDTLYNSGTIPGEGVHYYNENWTDTPSMHGFELLSRLPGIDIFSRI